MVIAGHAAIVASGHPTSTVRRSLAGAPTATSARGAADTKIIRGRSAKDQRGPTPWPRWRASGHGLKRWQVDAAGPSRGRMPRRMTRYSTNSASGTTALCAGWQRIRWRMPRMGVGSEGYYRGNGLRGGGDYGCVSTIHHGPRDGLSNASEQGSHPRRQRPRNHRRRYGCGRQRDSRERASRAGTGGIRRGYGRCKRGGGAVKLQRYTLSAHEDFLRREMYVAREPDPSGRYMDSADVGALRARIRAAVEALLAAPLCRCTSLPHYIDCEFGQAYNTLAALLGNDPGEPIIHQCPPTRSGGIMPCCGRTPFEVTGDRMADDPKLVTCRGRV